MYSTHHTPRTYGLKSYISVPIVLGDGEFFGTLCGIDPLPHDVERPEITGTLTLFARMLSEQIDGARLSVRTGNALKDAQRIALSRDQFIAVLGHDLRNPLQAISMGTGVLMKSAGDERSRRLLGSMQSASERMGSMIGEILDFARGQIDGGLDVNIKPDSRLSEALEEILDETRIAEPTIQIEADFDFQGLVVCDRRLVAQLFGNLLHNAIVYGDPSKPISAKARSRAGVFSLVVHNFGETIAADQLPTLFEPFARVGTGGSGLGLGLFICSEIARAHQGTLDVVSAAGETSFSLTFGEQVTTPAFEPSSRATTS
jgi:signal transduction histidine kinase